MASPNAIAIADQNGGPSVYREDDEERSAGRTESKKDQGDSTIDNAPERSTKQICFIMIALALCVFLSALDVTIVSTAVPTITEDFQAAGAYTWIGSAYLLATSSSVTIWGKLSDIFGRRPIILIANIFFLVGSVVAATSQSIGPLLVGRAIQGTGGGGLVVLANTIIGDLFSQRRRGTYYGVTGAVFAVASSCGAIVGGSFTEDVSWRWCFYVNLPLDGVSVFLIIFFLRLEVPKTPIVAGLRAIDWIGSVLFIGGTLMLLFALEYGGQTFPWNSSTVICLFVFGALSFGLFLLHEWKFAKFPIIPMRIFDRGSTICCLAVCFCHGFVFIGGSYWLPFYFQTVRGATPIESGIYVLPTTVSLAVFAASVGHFIRRTGKTMPPIFFGLIMTTLGSGLLIDLDRTSSWAKIIIYQIIGGCGIGPLFQAPMIAMQSFVKPGDIAAAVSTFSWARMLAAASSVVIGEVVFQNEMVRKQNELIAMLGKETAAQLSGDAAGANTKVVDGLPAQQRKVAQDAFADSLRYMWIMYTAVAAVGLFAALWIGKTKLSEQHEETKTGLGAEEQKRLEGVLSQRKKAQGSTSSKTSEEVTV